MKIRPILMYSILNLRSNALQFTKRSFSNIPFKLSPQVQDIDYLKQRIFCNVELMGDNLEAIGFDMDFTLAQYRPQFDLLAFEGAKEKLVAKMNYPKTVLDFPYQSDSFTRGLVIDRKRGNILKVDRHKYVRNCYHGSTQVDAETRKSIYRYEVSSYADNNYVNMDTLFSIVDANLFTHLVDLKDRVPDALPQSYEQLWKDLRSCVDLCHRDGAIKDQVMRSPHLFILPDPLIVHMLRRMRSAGKKLFLLTNSYWEYTQAVMSFLVSGAGAASMDGNHGGGPTDWREIFDLIVVGAAKPAFLSDNSRALFQVQRDGRLVNIDHKESINLPLPLSRPSPSSSTPSTSFDSSSALESRISRVSREEALQGRVFQGGHWQDLHSLLGIDSGDRVLYVGDHMFADILRSKRSLGWRTCLIVPELEAEIGVALRERDLAQQIALIRNKQSQLDEHLDSLWRRREDAGQASTTTLLEEIRITEEKALQTKDKLRSLSDQYNSKFNPLWGQLFKAGFQDSRFAKQLIDYACLYTSKASNLALINPNRSFRPSKDHLPHEHS